jgi:hypothetical protein
LLLVLYLTSLMLPWTCSPIRDISPINDPVVAWSEVVALTRWIVVALVKWRFPNINTFSLKVCPYLSWAL